MNAFGYNFNMGHSFFGGYGWILSKDNWFVFIPFPILEAEAILGFLIAFNIAYTLMWGVP